MALNEEAVELLTPGVSERLGGYRNKPRGLVVRRYLVLSLALAAATSAVGIGQASAASKPGWSLAKASAYIEFNLQISDPGIVAAAKEHLRHMKQIGDEHGIANAENQLRMAQAGLVVDHAACLGVKAAPGGFVSFKCKLVLSDLLGFKAKSVGMWMRLPTGKWTWRSTSFSLVPGPCPDGWAGTMLCS